MDEGKLRQLLEKFRLSLSGRIPVLEEAFSRMERLRREGAPWVGSEPFECLALHAHQLAGSSGSFGFTALGQAAAVLDLMLSGVSGRKEEDGWSDWMQVDVLYRRMMEAITGLHQEKNPLLEGDMPHLSSRTDPGDVKERVVLSGVDDGQARGLAQVLPLFDIEMLRGDGEKAGMEHTSGAALVLADVSCLDDVSGKRLRTRSGSPLPTIAVGVGDGLRDRIEACRRGARGYLCYPLDPFDVVALLEDERERLWPRREKVAIIDDDGLMLEVAELILRSAGMDVCAVGDPSRTLDLLRQFRPDLLVIDQWMPGFSGFETVAALRQHRSLTNLPVVFLSGDDSRNGRMRALEAGGDDYVSKPIDPVSFVSLVRGRIARFKGIERGSGWGGRQEMPDWVTFLAELETLLSHARLRSEALALLLIGFDVEEGEGHNEASLVFDSVQRAGSLFLRRKAHRIGHLCGNEFAIAMSAATEALVCEECDRVLEGFYAVARYAAGGKGVSFRKGLSVFPACGGVGDLVRVAGQAMMQRS